MKINDELNEVWKMVQGAAKRYTFKCLSVLLCKVFKLPESQDLEASLRRIAQLYYIQDDLEDRVYKIEQYLYKEEISAIINGEHFGSDDPMCDDCRDYESDPLDHVPCRIHQK